MSDSEELVNSQNLKELVSNYLKDDYEHYEVWLDKFKKHTESFAVIITNCICGAHNNNPAPREGPFKRCQHQLKMPRKVVNLVASLLQDKRSQHFIVDKEFKSFKDLFDFIDKIDQPYFREMAKYDFALRFGWIRGLSPELVYLHRGAEKGARTLYHKGFINDLKKTMSVAEFPEELQILEPHHIENFLCLKKDFFHNLNNK